MTSRFVLGLSGNTQSIGAVVIDIATGAVRWSKSLDYSKGIAQKFGLTGSFFGDGDGGWFWTPPMVAMALEAILTDCAQELGDQMVDICAISGGFHQHARFDTIGDMSLLLGKLDPSKSLVSQVVHLCSGPLFPCWMHSSAAPEAEVIAELLGGHHVVAKITGSAATPRFPLAPLMMELKKDGNSFWQHGRLLHSGSSYLPSLLCQDHVSLCSTEASAWNIMDIERGNWSRPICDKVDLRILETLPKIVEPLSCVGKVGPYFQQRFGFSPECMVAAFSGDNIVSLLGNGVTKPGMATLSLGTSWTVCDNATDPTPDKNLLGNVMCALTGGYMRMICQTNGGFALKYFREALGLGDTWDEFDWILGSAAFDPNRIILPFVNDESLGKRSSGVHYFGLDQANAEQVVPAAVYSLFVHLVLGTSGFLGNLRGRMIFGTGGGSRSRPLLQAAADVLGTTITPSTASDTVASGGAMMAAMCYLRSKGDTDAASAVPALFAQHGEPVIPNLSRADGIQALLRKLAEKLA